MRFITPAHTYKFQLKTTLDVVEEDFVKFNSNYFKLVQDFSKLTGDEFIPRSGDDEDEFASMASTSELGCEACFKKEKEIEALKKEIEALKKDLEDANSKILHLENN